MRLSKLLPAFLSLCLVIGGVSCSKMEIDWRDGVLDMDDEMSSLDPETKRLFEDWENVQTVPIYAHNQHTETSTPWSNEPVILSSLPGSIMRDVKKADGWEMAFVCLDTNDNNVNFFGLYNYRLGILRIFLWYIPNENATNASVEINLGAADVAENKYALYNMLAFAIPTCHKDLNMYEPFVTSSTPYTYKVFITPPNISSTTSISEGWTAVDLDLSGYNPTNTRWPSNKRDQIMLAVKSEKKENIVLNGIVSAKTAGKYSGDLLYPHTASSDGVGSVFSGIKKGTGYGGFVFSIIKSLSGKDVSVIGTVINAICSVGSFLSSNIVKSLDDGRILPAAVIDSLPGRIVLNTDGKVDLTGYSSSCVPSSVPTCRFGPQAIIGSKNFGNGVWSLQNDPVIYVVDDVMMGDEDRINLSVNKQGCYFNSEVSSFNLRMVQFLDPTSIKLNLNTGVFKQIDSVKISYCYGVYPSVPSESTKQYSDFMKLNRPTIPIITDSSTKFYYSDDPGKNIKYCYLPKEQFICSTLEETEKNSRLIDQKQGTDGKAPYKYYGSVIDNYTREFTLEPQVLFPISKDEKYGLCLNDGKIPDFVVLVTIRIKADGLWYNFSHRFIPQIECIKSSQIAGFINSFESYSSDCINKKAVGQLANSSSVPVYHPGGEKTAKKTLMILKAVNEQLKNQ